MSQKLVRFLPIAIFAIVATLSLTGVVHAQSTNDYEDLQLRLATGDENAFLGVLTSIINFILFAGGVIAFLFVLYGGFTYLTAGGDPNAAGKGRTMIVNAIIGIVIIFLSYTLVRFVIGRTETRQSGSEVRF